MVKKISVVKAKSALGADFYELMLRIAIISF